MTVRIQNFIRDRKRTAISITTAARSAAARSASMSTRPSNACASWRRARCSPRCSSAWFWTIRRRRKTFHAPPSDWRRSSSACAPTT